MKKENSIKPELRYSWDLEKEPLESQLKFLHELFTHVESCFSNVHDKNRDFQKKAVRKIKMVILKYSRKVIGLKKFLARRDEGWGGIRQASRSGNVRLQSKHT